MSQDLLESLLGGERDGGREPASAPPDRRLFNVFELRLFRYTAVLAALVALTALVVLSLWSLSWLFGAFSNLLLSLSVAGILALVLYPVVEFLENRLHLPRVLAVLLLLLVLGLGLGSLLILLVPVLVSQIVQLMTVLPETLARWQEHMSVYFPELTSMISAGMESSMESSGEDPSQPVVKETGGTVLNYLGLMVAIGFVPLFLFFTLLSGDRLHAMASELLSVFRERTRRKVLYFMKVLVEYITTFFQGQLIIAGCMGILYAAGFALIGLDFGVLAGVVLGFLNIVPFLGSLLGVLAVLPMAWLQPDGGAELLALAVLVFAVVQVVESWLLTPKIMADRSGLHPALVVISLFFWGTAFGGVMGIVLAVPLTAFIVAIWGEIKASLKHTLSNQEVGP